MKIEVFTSFATDVSAKSRCRHIAVITVPWNERSFRFCCLVADEYCRLLELCMARVVFDLCNGGELKTLVPFGTSEAISRKSDSRTRRHSDESNFT